MQKAEAFIRWLNMMQGAREVTICKAAVSPELAALVGLEDGHLSCSFMGVHITVVPDYGVRD